MVLWGYYLIVMYSLGGGVLTLALGGFAVQGLLACQLAAYVYCGMTWWKEGVMLERWVVLVVTTLLVAPISPFVNELVFGASIVLLHVISFFCMMRMRNAPEVLHQKRPIPWMFWFPVILSVCCIPWYLDQTRYMIS